MDKPSQHVPPGIIKNANVEQFFAVIDGMQRERNVQMLNFENLLNVFTAKENTNIKDFLFEAGQLPRLTDVPMFLVERLIVNSRSCFAKKGSKDGIEFFAWASVDGVFADGYNLSLGRVQERLIPDDIGIVSGSLGFGYLPAGTDLEGSVTDPIKYPFLFDGSFTEYYNTFDFELHSDYVGNPETRREWMRLFIEFLAMCSPGSSSVTVNFYTKADNVFLETLNI